jgi:hypothetical protein
MVAIDPVEWGGEGQRAGTPSRVPDDATRRGWRMTAKLGKNQAFQLIHQADQGAILHIGAGTARAMTTYRGGSTQ